MADDFWKSVYDKLVDNIELLRLIAVDTSNKDLLSWIKPNSRLKLLCARYMKNGIIADRNGLINALINYAKNDNPLRRIILLTWVDKNQTSMEFFKQPVNAKNIQRLAMGEFGSLGKIRILSKIEPRPGALTHYTDVINKLEAVEKERAEKEKANIETQIMVMPAISESELEAAIYSKEIVEAPEGNISIPSDVSFNEAVYEELQKIKAAVEILQDVNRQLKDENKDLRAEKGKRHTEIYNYSSKLEASVIENKKLKEELALLKGANSSLKTQLDTAKKEIASKPAPTLSDSEINDLRLRLEEVLKENQEYKRIVSSLDSSLNRLKTENEDLHRKNENLEDQTNLVKSLQQRLSDLNKKSDKGIKQIAGQIVTKTRFPQDSGEKSGKKCWLFVSVIGQVYYIDLADIPSSQAVPEEYVLITFEDDKIVSVESLESEKSEVYGFLKSESGKGYLSCEELGDLPVVQDVTEKWVGRPARGVFLPELDNRSAGIYKLEILPNTANLKKADTKNNRKYSEKQENISAEKHFNGQRVAVFGGDRAGLEYEKALGQIGLNAKWFSGFGLLSEISLGGFGKPDLIIIVTKQISHALLREINAYSEKQRISVAYSTRRGVSSVVKIALQMLE